LHKYMLYGLGVHSEIQLWEEEAEDCPEDVRVVWRCRKSAPVEPRSSQPITEIAPNGDLVVSWPGIAALSIRHQGKEMVVETRDRLEINHVKHLVAGMGMGLIWHQRGRFTLHASAVAIGSGGVAIAGPKYAGKSTTAAALVSLGHIVFSDDVLVLDMKDDGGIDILPGPSTLNLWPDAAEAMERDPESMPQIWSRSPKRIATIPATGERLRVPLRCIFFLEPSNSVEPTIESFRPTEALSLLVAHSHALRIVEDTESLPRHLVQCGRVANEVEIFRLRRPRSLASVRSIAEMIVERVNSLAPRESTVVS
jgi:hypothetical protein